MYPQETNQSGFESHSCSWGALCLALSVHFKPAWGGEGHFYFQLPSYAFHLQLALFPISNFSWRAGWLHQGDWSPSAKLHKAAVSNLGSIERIHGGIPQKILIAFSGQYRNISTVLEVLIANENNEVVFFVCVLWWKLAFLLCSKLSWGQDQFISCFVAFSRTCSRIHFHVWPVSCWLAACWRVLQAFCC